MTTNRQKLLDKVRALMSKTIDNGCTEAEAMSALSMAQAMMDEYEITEDDLKLEDEKAIIELWANQKDRHKIGWKLAFFVAKFTDTYTFGNFKYIKFAGLKSDVEFAIWLNKTLAEFVRTQLKQYMWANKYTSLKPASKRIVVNGFIAGCTQRINTRLKEMVDARRVTSNSTALAVSKQGLIDDVIKDLEIGKAEKRGRKMKMYAKSYEEGQQVGELATFGRPVGSGGQLRIK